MEAPNFTRKRLKTLMTEGLDELYQVLDPLVEKQMSTVYQDGWYARANQILKKPTEFDFRTDLSNLLRVIISDYDKTFASVLGSQGKTLINDLLTARNNWGHDWRSKYAAYRTFHVYNCLCQIFELLKHDAPQIAEQRDELHALVAQMAPSLEAGATDGDGEKTQVVPEEVHTDRDYLASIGGGAATPEACVTPETIRPWADGDEVRFVRIFSRKRLIAAGTVIGFLAIVGLQQVMNSGPAVIVKEPPPPPPPVNPLVESISPPTPTAQPNAQTVRVSGSGFRTGLKVVLEIPGGGSSILSGTHIKDLTDTSFAVVDAKLTTQGRYALSVENSDSSKSNLFVFAVAPSLPPPGPDNRARTKSVEENVALATTASKPSTPTAPAAPIMTTASNGFRYDLESCTASGTTVRCIFAVTNQEDDRELMIVGSARDRNGVAGSFAALNAGIPGTRAIDDGGNYATMREARLANYDVFGGTLIAGVRTRLVVVFDGISANAQTLSVLDLGSSIGSRGTAFDIQFRDVPLRR